MPALCECSRLVVVQQEPSALRKYERATNHYSILYRQLGSCFRLRYTVSCTILSTQQPVSLPQTNRVFVFKFLLSLVQFYTCAQCPKRSTKLIVSRLIGYSLHLTTIRFNLASLTLFCNCRELAVARSVVNICVVVVVVFVL